MHAHSLHQRIKQLETLQQDCVYQNFCIRGCIQVLAAQSTKPL
jgi:hypothetical protein